MCSSPIIHIPRSNNVPSTETVSVSKVEVEGLPVVLPDPLVRALDRGTGSVRNSSWEWGLPSVSEKKLVLPLLEPSLPSPAPHTNAPTRVDMMDSNICRHSVKSPGLNSMYCIVLYCIVLYCRFSYLPFRGRVSQLRWTAAVTGGGVGALQLIGGQRQCGQ